MKEHKNDIIIEKYKGVKIRKESDPWAIKHNQNYYADLEIDGETIGASTVDEARECIDDYISDLIEL